MAKKHPQDNVLVMGAKEALDSHETDILNYSELRAYCSSDWSTITSRGGRSVHDVISPLWAFQHRDGSCRAERDVPRILLREKALYLPSFGWFFSKQFPADPTEEELERIIQNTPRMVKRDCLKRIEEREIFFLEKGSDCYDSFAEWLGIKRGNDIFELMLNTPPKSPSIENLSYQIHVRPPERVDLGTSHRESYKVGTHWSNPLGGDQEIILEHIEEVRVPDYKIIPKKVFQIISTKRPKYAFVRT